MDTATSTGRNYSYEEAALELGWSRETVTNYACVGRIQKRVVDGKPRIFEADNADLFTERRAFIRAREAGRQARIAYIRAKAARGKNHAEPATQEAP